MSDILHRTQRLLDFSPVLPRSMPAKEACMFYHAMDLPGETVHGAWDLRGGFEQYIGGVRVAGKAVLDVGTATGFLAFSAEEAGATSVTAIDLLDGYEMKQIPFKENQFHNDRMGWLVGADAFAEKIKNGFWYCWLKKRSFVEVVYTPIESFTLLGAPV